MKKAIDWSEKKIGLVLSGGGAKGSYQIGMFRALEELGLMKQVKVISGTSIGALTGMTYIAAGLDAVRDLMVFFGTQLDKQLRNNDEDTYQRAKKRMEEKQVSLQEFLEDPVYSAYSSDGFRDYLKECFSDEMLKKSMKKLYVCAYCVEMGRPEYFLLNQLEPCWQRELTLASASLPLVFPAVTYNGYHYLDGGCIPPICGKTPEDADKIPLKPMQDEALDAILVDFLIPSDQVEHTWISEKTEYLELRPSYYLEEYPGAGTLDFSAERLQQNENLGYLDTMKLFLGSTENNKYQKYIRK